MKLPRTLVPVYYPGITLTAWYVDKKHAHDSLKYPPYIGSKKIVTLRKGAKSKNHVMRIGNDYYTFSPSVAYWLAVSTTDRTYWINRIKSRDRVE